MSDPTPLVVVAALDDDNDLAHLLVDGADPPRTLCRRRPAARLGIVPAAGWCRQCQTEAARRRSEEAARQRHDLEATLATYAALIVEHVVEHVSAQDWFAPVCVDLAVRLWFETQAELAAHLIESGGS